MMVQFCFSCGVLEHQHSLLFLCFRICWFSVHVKIPSPQVEKNTFLAVSKEKDCLRYNLKNAFCDRNEDCLRFENMLGSGNLILDSKCRKKKGRGVRGEKKIYQGILERGVDGMRGNYQPESRWFRRPPLWLLFRPPLL